MKTRDSLIVATLLASTLAGCSKHPPPAPQSITFAGFTNGYVGPLAPVFTRMGPMRATIMRQWLAAGTNSAMFIVTNQQSCDIYILATGRILNAGVNPTNAPAPILNAPNVSIRLKPGQVTNLQIAVLPHQAPCRMRVIYSRAAQHVGLIEILRCWIYQKPIPTRSYAADSELINQ
jgi:hypothetical protein